MDTSGNLDGQIDWREHMEALAEAAVICQPRMFAIYGVLRDDDDSILGWGLEFPDDGGTIFTDPTDRSLHLSETAERVRQVLSIIADVRLTWLDYT